MSKQEIDTKTDISKLQTEREHTNVFPKGEENLVNENEQVKSDQKIDLTTQMIPRDIMLYFYAFSLALGVF